MVERKHLNNKKEKVIIDEIENQASIDSDYCVRVEEAIKTDSRWYIFIEFCNGFDLKDLLKAKSWKLDP